MKTYEHMDWQNYKPNMELGRKAANQVAQKLKTSPNQCLRVTNFLWNEGTRRYMAFIPADIISSGNLIKIIELEGHYFNAICKFVVNSPAVVVELEEIDYGHYHRYFHMLKGLDFVCDDCPYDVPRDEAA